MSDLPTNYGEQRAIRSKPSGKVKKELLWSIDAKSEVICLRTPSDDFILDVSGKSCFFSLNRPISYLFGPIRTMQSNLTGLFSSIAAVFNEES